MSLWHSPQACESMKKLDGMMPPILVFADEGQKGDFGPPPSSAMETGTILGLRIVSSGFGKARSYRRLPVGRRTSSASAARNALRNIGEERKATGISAIRPAAAVMMWAYRTKR